MRILMVLLLIARLIYRKLGNDVITLIYHTVKKQKLRKL